MPTTGWFTSWSFWVGFVWGVSVTFVTLWHLLIRPMGRLLGFERED